MQPRRPYQPFGAITYYESGRNSITHQGQLGVLRRFSSGFAFQLEYQFTLALGEQIPCCRRWITEHALVGATSWHPKHFTALTTSTTCRSRESVRISSRLGKCWDGRSPDLELRRATVSSPSESLRLGSSTGHRRRPKDCPSIAMFNPGLAVPAPFPYGPRSNLLFDPGFSMGSPSSEHRLTKESG